MRPIHAACLSVALCAAPALAAGPEPFSVQHLVMFDRLSEPQLSPDGKTVAFVLRKTDLEANRGRTDLWAVGIHPPAQRGN